MTTVNNQKIDPLRERQLVAYGRGYREVMHPEIRFLGIVLFEERPGREWKENVSTADGYTIPDDQEARRRFTYRCQLVKVINVFAGKRSVMTLYLNGYRNLQLDVEKTEFVFDPALQGEPTADIFYHGYCTRYGDMNLYTLLRVVMTFRDRDHMKEYVVAVNSQDPDDAKKARQVICEGSSSFWPFVAGVGLGLALDD